MTSALGGVGAPIDEMVLGAGGAGAPLQTSGARRVQTDCSQEDPIRISPTGAGHRPRAALGGAVLALALAVTLLFVAPPADAQNDAPWPQYVGDERNTRRAPVAGPDDPGFKWHIDLAEVETDFAPEGYSVQVSSSGRGMPLVAPEGVLVMAANNQDKQYETSGSRRREVIGIDPDNGSVLWEVGNAGSRFGGRCEPGIDSRGRVWVHIMPVDGGRAVLAVDPADGEPVDGQQVDDLPGCDGSSLHLGGQGSDERLVLFDEDEVVAVDVSRPAGEDAEVAWRVEAEAGGFDEVVGVEQHRAGVFTDDSVVLAVRSGLGEGEDPVLELLELSLADGSERDRLELPVPAPEQGEDPISSGEYQRAYLMIADNGALVVGPRGGSVGMMTAIDLDGPMAQRWTIRLPGESSPRGLSHGDGVVITAPGGGSAVGVSIDDGSIVWADAPSTLDGGFMITDVDGAGYTRMRHGTTRARHLAQLDPATGEARWVISREAVADAAGVDHIDDLAVGGFANLSLQPIDGDGTFYVASRSSGNHGLLAIDNSGGLAEFVVPDEPDLGDLGVARVAGGDDGEPRSVAIEICQYLVDDGQAQRIALARDEDFADALAGSALPGVGCILFTPGGPDAQLHPQVRAEIDRAMAPGGEFVLLGGENAVSSHVGDELAAAGYTGFRVFGPTRYETAEQIAEQIGAEVGTRPEVLLASGDDWPDAITGGAFAAARTVPVLLTPPPGQTPPEWDLHPAAQRAMGQLGASTTYVVGGSAVVPDGAVAAAPGGQRVAGVNRMATAAAVAEQLWPQVTGFAGDRFVTANLEHVDGWMLALAAAPLSAQWSAPQLGLRTDSYPLETESYLTDRGFTELPAVALLGDVGFVSDEVAAELGDSIEP